jgi:hypothetical protein
LFVVICLDRLLLFVRKPREIPWKIDEVKLKLIESSKAYEDKNAAQRWPHAGDYETRYLIDSASL